jgi:DNA polymerase-3 subunit gamma/tau
VRNLVGAAPSGVLEEVMQAVAQGSSETVLRLVDRLISEGHSPTHFARQMVRFLRNAVVARVAGTDSSLLQISSDERQRVARIAVLFEEEDLARHLQIMLRTHGELGYRQEQRFHLELGLLKMAHAQRLLPIEQLLSETAGAAAHRPLGKPSVVPDIKRPEPSSATRSAHVSPFAADSARKSGSKPELSAENSPQPGSHAVAAGAPASVVMGSAAPALVQHAPQQAPRVSPETGPDPEIRSVEVRDAVLNSLNGAGHRILVNLLEAGEWQVQGNEVAIKVAGSEKVIEMSLGADARRLMIATASGALGRPMKLRVVPGGTLQAVARPVATNGGGRGRAEQDPVVRRMKEKFGAEIRTIIDYKEKR